MARSPDGSQSVWNRTLSAADAADRSTRDEAASTAASVSRFADFIVMFPSNAAKTRNPCKNGSTERSSLQTSHIPALIGPNTWLFHSVVLPSAPFRTQEWEV